MAEEPSTVVNDDSRFRAAIPDEVRERALEYSDVDRLTAEITYGTHTSAARPRSVLHFLGSVLLGIGLIIGAIIVGVVAAVMIAGAAVFGAIVCAWQLARESMALRNANL